MSDKVAVIVVGYNGQDYTENCLESLYNNTDIDFEVVAVNNGSSDDTLTILNSFKEKHSNFHVLSYDKNLGFAGGYNRGIEYALKNTDCNYVFILNNDTYVTRDAIKKLIITYKKICDNGYKQVGAIGPITNYISGRQCINVPKLDTFSDIDNFANSLSLTSQLPFTETGHLIGFAVLYTREVLEAVGLFDEQFFPGNWEDSDHQLRMQLAGYKSFIASDSFIYHYGSKTCKEVESEYPKHFYINRDKFYKKWADINKRGEHKRLIGVCRVKNGEQYLNTTLEAVSRMCDELVVFDDHSTDKTYDICKIYPKVHYIKSEFTTFDEARDRNFIINEAKKLNGDWVYLFDADEVPEEGLIENAQALMNLENPFIKAFVFKIDHFWNSPRTIRVDGLWGSFYQCRMYKLEPNQEIKTNGDDNLHCGSHPFFTPEWVVTSKYRIKHYGNMDPNVRKNKYEWYTKTDTNKDVKMVLGAYESYYKKLYGYAEDEALFDCDYYRHLIDETGLQLKPWVEYPTISLCVIAKNEEEHIEKMLESASLIADEIVVTIDSTSTDKTEDICRKYTDKIYKYVWTDEGFSGMRNFCISKASKNYILMLDGDEVLPKGAGKCILDAVRNPSVLAWMCKFKNWQDGDTEGRSNWELSETFRLFKNEPYLYFVGPVHEDLSESVEKAVNYTKVVVDKLPCYFYNYGYLKDQTFVKQKHAFYAELLKKQVEKQPDDCRAKLNYAVHLETVGNLDEAEKHLRDALKISPKLWLAHNMLGTICYKKALNNELLAESQRHFQQALACAKITPMINESKVERILNNFKEINSIRKSIM